MLRVCSLVSVASVVKTCGEQAIEALDAAFIFFLTLFLLFYKIYTWIKLYIILLYHIIALKFNISNLLF